MSEPGVAIVGGGAAGLSAAIAAARLGAPVVVLETGTRVGRKILASGNGRCNLTNTAITPSAYNQPDFVAPVLEGYSCDVVLSFFGAMGLLTRADDEGRVYPVTGFAGSVLDVMRMECERLGVDVRYGFKAVAIREITDDATLEVRSEDGRTVRAAAVVVATGGGSLLGDLGHEIIDATPVLGPLRTQTGPIRGLSGVRVKCSASLLTEAGSSDSGRLIATERGEILFRDYGLSGIMIFDLSRYLEPGCVVSIDLFPDVDRPELVSVLEQRRDALAWRTAETFFAGMLHDRISRAILRAEGIAANAPVPALPCDVLAARLKDFRLEVTGRGDASQAQVTRGGASVAGFDPHTMASRCADGLFAAGEVLDVDGRSGGFNLHWAWASGIVAGQAGARWATTRGPERDVDSGMPK
ncbi:MAG: aminoacetone oxidase family FAD-binding enzyme [Coriobacteriia bacterium]|nr:aminoacetone oxidase family FAD-binding enzyme [Coriobacteriia bacterium]